MLARSWRKFTREDCEEIPGTNLAVTWAGLAEQEIAQDMKMIHCARRTWPLTREVNFTEKTGQHCTGKDKTASVLRDLTKGAQSRTAMATTFGGRTLPKLPSLPSPPTTQAPTPFPRRPTLRPPPTGPQARRRSSQQQQRAPPRRRHAHECPSHSAVPAVTDADDEAEGESSPARPRKFTGAGASRRAGPAASWCFP